MVNGGVGMEVTSHPGASANRGQSSEGTPYLGNLRTSGLKRPALSSLRDQSPESQGSASKRQRSEGILCYQRNPLEVSFSSSKRWMRKQVSNIISLSMIILSLKKILFVFDFRPTLSKHVRHKFILWISIKKKVLVPNKNSYLPIG